MKVTNTMIGEALVKLGVNTENHIKVLAALPDLLADNGKCRQFIGILEGEDAIKSSLPLDLERYRKTTEKHVKAFVRGGSEPPKNPVAGSSEKEDKGGSVDVRTRASSEAPASATPAGKANSKGTTAMATAKKKTAKKKTASKKSTENKKPGVIDAIVEALKVGGTVTEIAAKLAKKFPDRDADGLKATTKIQVHRLKTTRKLKIKTSKNEGTNELTYKIG